MTLRVVVEISGAGEPLGLKEKLAMDFERYGDVRIVDVRAAPKNDPSPEQLRIEG